MPQRTNPLQDDPNHCGTCDRACSLGIACRASVCQQTVCTGTTVPLSAQPTTNTTDAGASPYPFGNMDNQILADVNGDGRLDRIDWFTSGSVCQKPGSVQQIQTCTPDLSEFLVSLRQLDGSFAPPDTYNASDVISRVLATDVNGDGLADLYVVSWTYTASTNAKFHVELWLGQKDGHLLHSDAGIASVDTAGGGSEIAIDDLSGDGWPDLVIAAPTADPNISANINVYLSDSTGALHLSQRFAARFTQTFIRDWNGDGSPDLALLDASMEILYNRGDGTFEQPLNCALVVAAWTGEGPLVEDFNRDGHMDIASVDIFHSSRVAVMLGLGGCGFAPIRYYEVPGSSIALLRAADMNGDGILDIVGVGRVEQTGTSTNAYVVTDNLLFVLLGNPDGTFRLQDTATSLGPNITDVTIGEATGDQRPDIVISTVNGQSGQTITWENTCQ